MVKKRKKVCKELRIAIFDVLFGVMVDGALPDGTITKVARNFSVSRTTVYDVYARGLMSDGNIDDIFADARKNNRKPPKYEKDRLMVRIREIPYEERSTLRDTAQALGISKSTFQRYIKAGDIFRPCSAVLKPKLTEFHGTARLP
jgi:DNA invertase Pin-like site-specific DNA recombinase